MTVMYHASPRKYRELITKTGLKPGSVISTEKEARYFGEQLWIHEGDEGKDWDLWEVDPSGLALEPDPDYTNAGIADTWTVPSGVSPDRLRLSPTVGDNYITAALQPEVRFTFEHFAAILHEAAWTDVAAKAKRLVQEGKVTILRNAPHHVMAHVIGDGTDNNGTPDEHDVEISRSLDEGGMPTSNTIEQWNCTCAWSDFAWDRTRKWKKYEGRPCSHVIATYWKAKSTPLDTTDMPEGYQTPRGQKQSPAGQGQLGIPGIQPPENPAQLGAPEGTEDTGTPGIGPGDQPQSTPASPSPTALPSDQDLKMPKAPASPFSTPKQQPQQPQHEQLQLFDITKPPGYDQAQQLQLPIVSVPGGSPPTPGNPVKFPGTFSHFIPVLAMHTSQFIYAADSLTEYFDAQRAAGQTINVALTNTVALERSGGKIPTPGAEPHGVSQEGIPMYNVMELGWNPKTQNRENADVNLLQGAPEQTGTYSDVMPGKYAEVLDYEPNLKMAYIIVPLNYPDGVDARLHPHMLKGWVSYSDIRPVNPVRTPFRRKK